MLRLSNFLDAVEAAYVGSETWYTGAEHIHANENALNRIVAAPTNGTVLPPGVAAQGWTLANVDPSILEGVDDIQATRRVAVDFYVWASDFATAENRLHALVIALLDVAEASLGSITERWPQQGDTTSGGAMVVLTVVATVFITAGDRDVVSSSADVGTGGPTDVVTGIDITAHQDNELIATVAIEGQES